MYYFLLSDKQKIDNVKQDIREEEMTSPMTYGR